MTIQHVPLDQLQLSARNARKTGAADISALAASISAHGLLQNLNITEGERGFEVVAGGRRLAALQMLAERGAIASDYPVPVQLVADEGAFEASTAENILREPMHPADQFDAFRAMVDAHQPIEDVAAHFGVSEVVVKQRLRLARLSPRLLDAYRRGDATLAQMIALSITDDHAHQEKVWAAAKNEWQRDPLRLREQAVGKKIPSSTGVGAFVDVDEYQAAGGALVRDLFAEEAYFADPGLAEKLALRKLQDRAATLKAEGWGWTEARIKFDWQAQQKFKTVRPEWKGGKEIFRDEHKAVAGAIVALDQRGKLELHLGLLKPGQKDPSQKSTKKNAKTASKTPGQLSVSQQSMLAGFRTGVARLELSKRPRVMLAVLAADLATRYLDDSPHADHVVYLDRNHQCNGMQEFRRALEESAPEEQRADNEQKLAAKLRKDAGKEGLLPWLLKQPESVTHELLAAVSSSFLNLSLGAGDELAAEIDLDFGRFWSVSVEWLLGLQKPTIIAIVREIHGTAHDEVLQTLKRDDIAIRAAELLAGSGWLPETLRGSGYAPKKPALEIAGKAAAKTLKKNPKKIPAKKKAAPKKAARKALKTPAAKP